MSDIIKHACDINELFQEAIRYAGGDANDDMGGVKWAIVAAINHLRDEGMSDAESLAVAKSCVDEVCGFIAALDAPSPNKLH